LADLSSFPGIGDKCSDAATFQTIFECSLAAMETARIRKDRQFIILHDEWSITKGKWGPRYRAVGLKNWVGTDLDS
jgi:hypothetical protein